MKINLGLFEIAQVNFMRDGGHLNCTLWYLAVIMGANNKAISNIWCFKWVQMVVANKDDFVICREVK